MKKFLAALFASFFLLTAFPSLGAITYFGSAASPVDADPENEQDGSVARGVTPPGSMQVNDIVYYVGMVRNSGVTPAMSETGGQSWNSLTGNSSGSSGIRIFWCVFNGTWTADPTIDFSGTSSGATVVMHVFRPTSTSHTISVDVAQSTNIYSAPTTPFDVTIPGITTLTNNALVIASIESADDNTWSVQTGGWSTAGNAQYRNGTGSDSAVSTAYQLKATAGATGDLVMRQASNGGDGGHWVIMAFKETAGPPTFSGSPAIGTRTTSSIPVTATTACTDCTFFGVAMTDGSAAPTCDQIEAQTVTGGYKYFSQAMTGGVQGTGTFTGYTDGTVRDGAFCLESTANGDSTVAAIADMYKIPAFSANPTVSAQTTNGYTISKTLDGPGTVYAVACLQNSTAATVTQAEAGNCTGNVAALAAANDDATGTFTLGGSLTNKFYDIYVVGTYGGQHEAAVHALVDEQLDCVTGKQCVTLTSIDTGSWVDQANAVFTTDIASGDTIEIDEESTPSGFAWPQGADGNGEFGPEADETWQYLCARVHRPATGTWMSFDSVGICGTGYLSLNINNHAPIPPDPGSMTFYGMEGVPLGPIDLSDVCADPDGHEMIVTNEDPLPDGLSIVDNILTGTPTTRGVTTGVEFSCTDITGASTVFH